MRNEFRRRVLRKTTRSQGKSERAKTVLSEGKVALATLREEKRFAAGQIWSGGGGALCKTRPIQKARYYSSVSVLYLATLLFAWYLFSPFPRSGSKEPAIYALAPLPPQFTAVAGVPVKPVISGKPIRIVISQADNGLNIDLPVEDGNYNAKDNTWSLSEQNAHFATPSVLSNDSMGTTMIYGHNNKFVFGHLSAIRQNTGASAQIYTDNGHIFTYAYDNVDTVNPDDTSVFDYQGAPKLTVQTCGGSFFENRKLFNFKLQKVNGRDV